MTHTAKDEVLGTINACGPCSFRDLKAAVLEQVQGINTGYQADVATVAAINELARNGEIELYDTGDAWGPA